MMNVYIGNRESNSTPPAARTPPAIMKPPPEKLAPLAMNNPPRSQTPASMDRPIRLGGAPLFAHFVATKMPKKVKGITAVMIRTSNELNLYARTACRSVSGNQKLVAPSSINLGTCRRCSIHDHRTTQLYPTAFRVSTLLAHSGCRGSGTDNWR